MVGNGSLRLPSIQSITAKFKTFKGSTSIGSLQRHDSLQGSEPLVLHGWLHRKPKKLSKNLTFAHIRDTKGDVIQVVDRSTPSLFRNLKPDSSVSVQLIRQDNDIECRELSVLGSANLIPGELQAEETKEWPAKYRYIQLRQPKFQKILRTRAAIIRSCRSVLDSEGFTEIETPILFKSTPEGAREFLVPTRRKGYTYALPQSPQQYKQLLIASGIDKYYQVAKCFRDEDLRADRQPEFTQLDLEMAFSNVFDVQSIVEKVAKAAWTSVGRSLVTLSGPKDEKSFRTLNYEFCIANYGIDKPDLRSDILINQLKGVTAKGNSEFPVLECIRIPQSLRRRFQENTPQFMRNYPRVRLLHSENETKLRDEISKLGTFSDSEWPKIYAMISDIGTQKGDILALGDRQELSYENPTPLGRLRQHLVSLELENSEADSNQMNGSNPSIAVWVQKFPSFEPLETGVSEEGYPSYNYKQLKATHHPFTMVDFDDYKYLENGEPLKCHGMHFDLVIDGVEVGGGSQRIHDSDLQRYILQNVIGVEDPDYLFGHLLEALDTGCPPHAGLAIGLDRMIAMLLGLSSIRDVIAFPKTNAGADPVVGSPSKVTPQQLEPYRLKID